jgi:1-acyl-sn-glycerol-3-phosphate acyltransferase
MPPWADILLLACVLGFVLLAAVAIAFAPWFRRAPRRDPLSLLAVVPLGLICRLYHRTRYLGREHIPTRQHAGGLIVVANHTAGLDPLLIQHACPFFIRWMMWRQMMLPIAAPLWLFLRILPLGASRGEDLNTMREAVRHLSLNGTVGIFPEGGIERPPQHLMKFRNGTGLLVHKASARVLPVVITGTHPGRSAWSSLFVPSRPTVTFHPVITYPDSADPADITADLHARFAAWTGWPSAN